MRIFTCWHQQGGVMLSKPSSIKRGGFACQLLGNVDMYVIKNIMCGSRVLNISLSANGRTNGRILNMTDSRSDYSADPRVMQNINIILCKTG